MSSLVEYHGWVVLHSSNEHWSDDEWSEARERAAAVVSSLRQPSGHAAHIDWPANGGSVVALNGWTDSRDQVVTAIATIAALTPDSYGELVIFPPALPCSFGEFGISAVALSNGISAERLLVRRGQLVAPREVQAIQEFRATLAALQFVNSWSDHAATFSLEELPRAADLLSGVREHFRETNYSASISAARSSASVFQDVGQWLFTGLASERVSDVSQQVRRQFDALPARNWFSLELSADGAALTPWYEAARSDFLMETNTGAYLLHLGISD